MIKLTIKVHMCNIIYTKEKLVRILNYKTCDMLQFDD